MIQHHGCCFSLFHPVRWWHLEKSRGGGNHRHRLLFLVNKRKVHKRKCIITDPSPVVDNQGRVQIMNDTPKIQRGTEISVAGWGAQDEWMDGAKECLGDVGNGKNVPSSCDAISGCERRIRHVGWNDTMTDSQWCDIWRSCKRTFAFLHSPE